MAYRHHRFPLAAHRVPLSAVFAVLLALALLCSIPALAAAVVGSGTPESCTEAALDGARGWRDGDLQLRQRCPGHGDSRLPSEGGRNSDNREER
jgi:hypothetical protein